MKKAMPRQSHAVARKLRWTMVTIGLLLPLVGILATLAVYDMFGSGFGAAYRNALDMPPLDPPLVWGTQMIKGLLLIYALYCVFFSWPFFVFALRLGRSRTAAPNEPEAMRGQTRLRIVLWALPQLVLYFFSPVDFVGPGAGVTYLLLLWIPFVTVVLSFIAWHFESAKPHSATTARKPGRVVFGPGTLLTFFVNMFWR